MGGILESGRNVGGWEVAGNGPIPLYYCVMPCVVDSVSIWFSKPPMDDHRFLAPFLPVSVIGRSKNLWSPDYPIATSIMGRPIFFIGPTRHRHNKFSTCCAPIGTHTGVALHGPTTTRVESWGPSIETHQNLGGRTTRTASQWAWLPSDHRIRADEL